MIVINLAEQTLRAEDGRVYRISSAKKGAGEMNGSNKTPRGMHVVRAKIGEGAAANTVFVGRRPTGETYTPELAKAHPGRDWILTRILWLGGAEPGKNMGGDLDTFRRYIYIHGAPDSAKMGVPGSIGCVRMHNADIMELFAKTKAGARVNILEK